jgi:Na+-transporting NADH:ubiquinone oxidoreductase subunit NqrB
MKFFKDARDYQIIFLSFFLIVGIVYRDWTLQIDKILLITLTCCCTQIILNSLVKTINYYQQDYPLFRTNLVNFIAFSGIKSALITSLGLSLLLRANQAQTLVIAGCLAITSKFIFTYHHKHWFNPANFGIILTLVCTNDAWVSPGQWGSNLWYLLLFMVTGAMVLNKVGRWETTAVFFSIYASLEAIYHQYLGWNFAVLSHQLMSGSLLVFAFFMLTDPRSIPNAKNSRIIWSIAIAILSFILKEIFYLNTAIFWALFIISPLTIILDLIWSESRFRWQNNDNSELIVQN